MLAPPLGMPRISGRSTVVAEPSQVHGATASTLPAARAPAYSYEPASSGGYAPAVPTSSAPAPTVSAAPPYPPAVPAASAAPVVPVAPGPAPIPARQVTREDIMRLTVAQLRAEIAKYVVLSNLLSWFCVQRTCVAFVFCGNAHECISLQPLFTHWSGRPLPTRLSLDGSKSIEKHELQRLVLQGYGLPVTVGPAAVAAASLGGRLPTSAPIGQQAPAPAAPAVPAVTAAATSQPHPTAVRYQ